MPEKKPTKDQHFVPKVYLQGFTNNSKTLYEYNLKTNIAIDKPVSIESICKKQYLYEIRDNQGEIVNKNFIENILCQYEGSFSEYRRKLLSKIVHKANFQSRCFLSKEEKNFWYFYTTLQLMRHPITLLGIKDIIKDELKGHFSDQEAYNFAVAYCLPIYKKPETGELNALTFFLSILLTKVLTVGYAESDNLFTSDHAMCGSRKPGGDLLSFQRLWFPISSNCALIFSDPTTVARDKRNRLIPISEEEVNINNNGIAYIAAQMILSKRPFTDSDIAIIRAARSERELAESQNKRFDKSELEE